MKSMPRRVEALERRLPRQRPSRRPGWLLGELEKLPLSRPAQLGDDYWEAWDRYVAVRDQLEAAGEMPPPDYYAKASEDLRIRLWRAWHCPQIDRVLLPVFTVLIRSFERS